MLYQFSRGRRNRAAAGVVHGAGPFLISDRTF
jgi:phage shock protein PspC (stress-responsive transcriptional regulator)